MCRALASCNLRMSCDSMTCRAAQDSVRLRMTTSRTVRLVLAYPREMNEMECGLSLAWQFVRLFDKVRNTSKYSISPNNSVDFPPNERDEHSKF